MSEESPEVPTQQLEFLGMEAILGVHADAFFVVRGGDTFTVYFFQHQIPNVVRRPNETKEMPTDQTKCFARISLSPMGMVSLATALAANLNCDITPRKKEDTTE